MSAPVFDPEVLLIGEDARNAVIEALQRRDWQAARNAVDEAFERLGDQEDGVTADSSVTEVANGRIAKMLSSGGVETIGQLCEFSFYGLAQTFQLRRKSVAVIQDRLLEHGFSLQ